MQNSIKGVLSYCKLKVILKAKLCNNICFTNRIPQILTLGVVYKFQHWLCNESYYGACVRHLVIRSCEHTGISSLTKKMVQLRKDNATYHHLLNCNYLTSLKDFSVLCRAWKIEKLLASFLAYVKVCLRKRCVRCYFLHAQIVYVHACTQSMCVMIVFMNAKNLDFTLNIFPLSLLTYLYKILNNSFGQFVNNLCYVL